MVPPPGLTAQWETISQLPSNMRRGDFFAQHDPNAVKGCKDTSVFHD